MKIIKAGYEIMDKLDGQEVLKNLELCGRVCYKSEGKIEEGSAEAFVRNLIRRGHESVLEHVSFSVRFIVDRGVSHEIVRHRLASYSQESTRYCNYSGDRFGEEITVIAPCFMREGDPGYWVWLEGCEYAEQKYFEMLDDGRTPQEARSVLPNSLKTELVMTANLREWRHFLRLRTAPAAHPQMREVTVPLLAELKTLVPMVFDDICNESIETKDQKAQKLKTRCREILPPMYRAFWNSAKVDIHKIYPIVYVRGDLITIGRLNNKRIERIIENTARELYGRAWEVVYEVGSACDQNTAEIEKLLRCRNDEATN